MNIQHFASDDVDIAFIDEGDPAGPPIVLIHGFASNVMVNWVSTGWVDALTKGGRRVIAFDNRGHGNSEKLYEVADYSSSIMAEDARRLLDHLRLSEADVMGYSMGAKISAFLAINHPERVRRLIFGGLGINMVHGVGGTEQIVAALESQRVEDVSDPTGRAYRLFAEQTVSDLGALAACMQANRVPITAQALSKMGMPTLVAVGTDDPVAGDPAELAALIPHGRAFHIAGRDHMKAVGDRTFKSTVLGFLSDDA